MVGVGDGKCGGGDKIGNVGRDGGRDGRDGAAGSAIGIGKYGDASIWGGQIAGCSNDGGNGGGDGVGSGDKSGGCEIGG